MKLVIEFPLKGYRPKPAMDMLEEAAIALTQLRGKEHGHKAFYADYGGWNAEYNGHAFEIGAEELYPELIVALEDLQKLGAFKMHFEHNGSRVADDWWRDEQFELYEFTGRLADEYYFGKLEELTA